MAFGDRRSVEDWLNARRVEETTRGRVGVGAEVGEWRVEAFLGSGLSAEVYRVVHRRFGCEGALKLLVDPTRGLKERFLAEADSIRFLMMRELPKFIDAGEYEGSPYYVMEYLQPLPDPMPRRMIPGFMTAVAKAVQSLHDAGYIHRDLKPGNILRRANGEPVLIDLGLIKRIGADVIDPIVRHGNGISIIDGKPVGVGTLDFAAPEQLLRGECSVESDVFSLGKILRAMYEGNPPHSLKSVIRHATRELPSDRYRSAGDFAVAIRRRNLKLHLGLSLALVGILLLSWPMMKDCLVKTLVPQADYEAARAASVPPKAKESFQQRPDETDAAYFARIAPIAEKGSVGAQASLGLCYLRGTGCVRDYVAAFKWLQLAADRGNPAAMTDLAYCYMHGFGVPKDQAKGFRWAQTAAEQGHVTAQVMVGECYLDGLGVEKDLDLAKTWLGKAAEQGSRRAAKLLRERQ